MMRALLPAAIVLAAPATAQTQAELNRMSAADLARADAALNRQYRATMAAMRARDAEPPPPGTRGPTYAGALLAAQRAWIAWRDAECLLAGYRLRGGSAQPMEETGCRARLTERRTAELKAMADF